MMLSKVIFLGGAVGISFFMPHTVKAELPYGSNTCIQGYVWREAVPKDHVCVRPGILEQVKKDNAPAEARFARSQKLTRTCAIVPSTLVANAINTSFDYLRPQIHINQVNSKAVRRKSKNIYLAGDNWVEVGGKRKSLGDFKPYYRIRRSHYVQDLNSVDFKVSPVNNGLRLRVDFETKYSEIKGWCHKCWIKGRRDRAAADMNILPKSGRYPGVEATLDFNYKNGSSNIGLGQVYLDMKLDGNGFLELFEGLIEKKVKPKIANAINSSWNQSRKKIEKQVDETLSKHLNLIGKSYSISSINFNGRTANVCIQIR